MTMFSQVLQDTESITRDIVHVKEVTYEAQIRWETATRLGADLAAVATVYLRAEANENGDYSDVGRDPEPYRLALVAAIEAYRIAESADFWAPGTLTYEEAVQWERSLVEEAAE